MLLGVRDTASPRPATSSVGRERIVRINDALDGAEVVVIAIPGAVVAEALPALGAQLDRTIVVDASNNVQAPIRNSLAAIASAAPSARRFRAFNSLPVTTLSEPTVGGRPADLFYCGADDADRNAVEALIRDAGLSPIYVGGLDWAPVVDALGGLSLALGRSRPGQRLALNLVTQ